MPVCGSVVLLHLQPILALVTAHLRLSPDFEWPALVDLGQLATTSKRAFPFQRNGFDCGMFALRNIQKLLQKPLEQPIFTQVLCH